MTRPLFYKTAAELEAMIERNARNAAELKLVQAELRHRDTRSAKMLSTKIDKLLNQSTATKAKSALKASSSMKPVPRHQEVIRLPDQSAASADRAPLARPASSSSGYQPDSAEPPRPQEPAPMTNERRWTDEAVAGLRTKLIDLSKKNPLIAFKHGGRATTHIRIVDERPDLFYATLCKEPMGFEPLPDEEVTPKDELTPDFHIAYERARLTDPDFLAATEKLGDEETDARAWQTAERALRQTVRRQLGLPIFEYGKSLDVKALARAHGFDPAYDLRDSDDGDIAEHHEDDRLRVLLTAKELEKRLKGIYDKFRTHQRETGLHTLYLCLGFVQWFEDDSSDIAHNAPVLIVPVRLEQKVVRSRYEYTLVIGDEGLEVSVALQEKMKQHWGLDTPALRENETPESYFVRLATVLEQGRRLSLRRFATIAVLPFPRMVLWKDLDPAVWPEAAFAKHSLLPGLLNARSFDQEPAPLDAPDIDAEPWATIAPPLIQPADASQHAALIDVAQGQSIAIEGPPGTGKSQTITNMIATALKSGKRVLFVAEKQAALSVVASRLRHAGFGPLLLELHGETAKREAVYNGIRERLAARPKLDATRLANARTELARKRDVIRRYLSLIAEPLGKLGRTAYQSAWREIRLRDSLSSSIEVLADRWQPGDAVNIDATILAERRSALADYGRALSELQKPDNHTFWSRAKKLEPFDQRLEIVAATEAAAATREVNKLRATLVRLGIDLTPPDGPIGDAAAQIEETPTFEDIDEAVARSALRHSDSSRSMLVQANRWRLLHDRLQADVENPAAVGEEQITALADALRSIGEIPESLSDLRADLRRLRQAETSVGQAADDVSQIAELLNLEPATPTSTYMAIITAMKGLGQLPPTAAALTCAALLDPLTRSALERETQTAAGIRQERSEVDKLVRCDALEANITDLNDAADVIEGSGFFARLFSQSYKSADRRAKRWLKQSGDRRAQAESLRRTARHLRQSKSFRDESPIRSLFPAVLWEGSASDWDAASSAASALKEAQAQLRAVRAESVLDHWLTFGSADRERVEARVQRTYATFQCIEGLGFDELSWSELNAAITKRRTAYDDLIRALEHIGARPEALLLRDGEDLASRLGGLTSTKGNFASLAASEGFEWAQSVDQDLSGLARALNVVEELRSQSGPITIADAVQASDRPVELLDTLAKLSGEIREAIDEWKRAHAELLSRTGIKPAAFAPDWEGLCDELSALAEDRAGARAAAELLKYRANLDAMGLDALADAALAEELPPDVLSDAYELLVVRALNWTYLSTTGAELGRLGSLTLESARRTFVQLDEELHKLEAADIISARLKDQAPRGVDSGPVGGYTNLGLLQHELGLRRPRTPIRDLTHRAGCALQALKPVWMMSPTSAAQFVRPGSLEFDLLVIDEASQMRPEFAVSAIMRAQQIVVVGDANQLPPSDFFSSTDAEDEEDEATVQVNTESILDLSNQRLRRKRRLRWHYRSQHESLIQYSNREFYERDLVIFPSPTTDDELLGLKHRYVGGTYEASINQTEAQAVIEEAFRLMRAYPERSLGIATMNAKQAELIRAEFDRLVLEQREVRAYVDAYSGGIEEFFIKNLENVQGDERDIILISTVYGADKNGVVMQRFGPMNREVGWRRLNVLVTRAKLSTRLFTSLKPEDIKVTEKSSRGVLALKSYLTYAAGGVVADDVGGGEPDSDFEIFVAEKLRSHGYEVVPQVGVEGFRIDLGVRHPDYPIGFIAGVECDGARWHTGLSVRDRDRIRQTVLENMGWRIHRIWSTDWFADPDREIAKLLHKLEDWRARAAAEFASRPSSNQASAAPPDVEPVIVCEPEPLPAAKPVASKPANDEMLEEELGKPMRSLDGIEWNEVIPGRRYVVMLDGDRAGTVEVLSRAVGAPRLYGGQIAIARSEFEGWVASTGERFRMHDIYATVREVARRAGSARELADEANARR